MFWVQFDDKGQTHILKAYISKSYFRGFKVSHILPAALSIMLLILKCSNCH